MQSNQFYTGLKRGTRVGMDTSLEWMIVVGRRRFTNVHRTERTRRGRPEQSWKNKMTAFMRSRNVEEVMAENIHLWRLGIDR